MKIKDVEELVGITKKNIRFYEEQGLLNVERRENGYREYHQKDVDILLRIKLFRKLGLPIEIIKDIFEGRKDVYDCLEKHVSNLEKQQHHIEVIKQFCLELTKQETINISECLEEIEKLEKQGSNFVDINKDTKKASKRGATVGAGIAIAGMVLLHFLMYICQKYDPLPILLYWCLQAIPFVIMVAVIVTLFSRFKEIDVGEIEEAKKY